MSDPYSTSIGGWTPQQLEQFIRNQIQQDASTLPHVFRGRGADLSEYLLVRGKRVMPSQPAWTAWCTTTTAQSIPNNAATVVTWDQELRGDGVTPTNGSADPSQSAGTFTIQEHGWYIISATLAFTASATGDRLLFINSTGQLGTVLGSSNVRQPAATGASRIAYTTADYMRAGDTVQILAQQNSGGALAMLAGSSSASIFKISDR